ncbi:GspH/FimT family pseudopilin [Pseudomonas sp. REP124]|uniref:GspH/FimT family pseudopilin n=1 Tax=Pseudomonas sp. REP124 TaxID=2875731 RepID=UPI001CCBC718|nr:GspH/FimT family protein [Pseudomonas sp. REP124]MBZ9783168.1 GspH/FimT family pseudopilin [Pseudomonas sp. REP124]
MHQRGFSLVELLMGLTIAGIVLHLVSPAFAAVVEVNHREEAARSLANGMRSARSEAISRNQTVVIHGIDGDWGQGWRIILDISGRGHEDASNPLLIERRSGRSLAVFGNQHITTSARFSPLGAPEHNGRQAGTLFICAAREQVSMHQVVLAPSGRISLRSNKTAQELCAKGLKAPNERVAL